MLLSVDRWLLFVVVCWLSVVDLFIVFVGLSVCVVCGLLVVGCCVLMVGRFRLRCVVLNCFCSCFVAVCRSVVVCCCCLCWLLFDCGWMLVVV